jgi:hypothetical protein
MKKIYCFLVLLLCLASCYEDKGNYDYLDVRQVEVTGIDSIYVCNLSETLEITPQLSQNVSEGEFDYMWMCYDKKDLRKKIDTLSTDKHLTYKMDLPLSSYQLIFAYQDKKSKVTKYAYSSLTVQSGFSRGWYMLKEYDGNTELDLFAGQKRYENIFSTSFGKPMVGLPQHLGFAKYTWFDEAAGELVKGIKSFMVLTDKEMGVVRIADMKMLASFKDLFFEDVPTCKPTLWFSGSEENGFVNDGLLYAYSERNGELGLSKFAFPKEGHYELSPVFTKNATMSPLMFDLNSGKFCTSYKTPDKILILEDDGQSKYKNEFADYTPVYFGFLDEGLWEGGKMYAVLRHKTNGTLVIVYVDSNNLVYYDDSFLKNRITKIQTIAASQAFNKATCFAQNRKFEMMYFSVDDKLYCYDLANTVEYEVKRENGQPAIPAGEQISMMKHIVFNYQDYLDPNVQEYVDRLCIVTSNGTSYKLYLFETLANKVKDNPEIYEGKGKPQQVFYMSPYLSDVDVCY